MDEARGPDGSGDVKSRHITQQFVQAPEIRHRATEQLPAIGVEVVGGPMDGQSFSVEGSVVTIGRSDGNDLCLALDSTVSTRHARIVREDNHFWLEDLGSTNGTYLGDQRITERTLIGPGTVFRMGCTHLEFCPR